jgi:hypothetical protein
MKLINSISLLYQEIGKKVSPRFSNAIKVVCERQLNDQTGAFTITLEILILEKILDADNGMVLSTNAQKGSHFGSINTVENGLYLMSDFSYGTGEIISSTDEVVYIPFEESNRMAIWNIIENFTISQSHLINEILTNRYGLVQFPL